MDITTLAAANAYTDKKVAAGGGFETIEMTTTFSNGAGVTDAETEMLTNAWNKGQPIILKMDIEVVETGISITHFSTVASPALLGGSPEMASFLFPFGKYVFMLYAICGAGDISEWGCLINTL